MRLLTAIAVLTAIAASPAVTAWSSFGGAEPSTIYDDATLMWADAPVHVQGRIYFNAVTVIGGVGGLGVNPNVGALSTGFESVGSEYHTAILGLWRDCNGDGYVGALESAVREYDEAFLLDRSTCPSSSGSPNRWNGEHNYNGWVTELIPIGNVRSDSTDARVIYDPDAMVWGDYGSPGADTRPPPLLVEESDLTPTVSRPDAKESAEWNFVFYRGERGTFPTSLVRGGRAGMPGDLGVGDTGSGWGSDALLVKPTVQTVTVDSHGRARLGEGYWLTFYARVGSATTSRGLTTPGGSGLYGAEACGPYTSGIQGGWNCDRDAWYRYHDGTPWYEPHPYARLGLTYQLRDVDCYDGGERSFGLGVGPAFYGDAPCASG